MYALQGDALLAVEYCHKALDKERQDPFTLQLLEMSLAALAGSYSFFQFQNSLINFVFNRKILSQNFLPELSNSQNSQFRAKYC